MPTRMAHLRGSTTQKIHLDILPALKARIPTLEYYGLRDNLFLWGYSPRRFVEQAYRWLCQTAVTPIL